MAKHPGTMAPRTARQSAFFQRRAAVCRGFSLLPLFIIIGAFCMLPGCRHENRIVTIDLLQETPEIISPTVCLKAQDESTRQLIYEGFRTGPDGQFALPLSTGSARFGFYAINPVDCLSLTTRSDTVCDVWIRINGQGIGGGRVELTSTTLTLPIASGITVDGLNLCTMRLTPEARTSATSTILVSSITFGKFATHVVKYGSPPRSTLRMSPPSEVSWCINFRRETLEFSGILSSPQPSSCHVEIFMETDRLRRTSIWNSTFHLNGDRTFSGEVNLAPFGGAPARIIARLTSDSGNPSLVWNRFCLTQPGHKTPPAASTIARLPARPNVIFFLIDALRRDHLSTYGYNRPTSPTLDRLAATSAVVFDNAWTQSAWTGQSVASLFTGEYPSTTGIRNHSDSLFSGFTTIAEFLKAAGYRTIAFVANFGLGTKTGYSDGFVEFNFRQGEKVAPLVDEAISRVPSSGQPFFMYIHVMDVHFPYRSAPAPFNALVQRSKKVTLTEEEISIKKLKQGTQEPTAANMAFIQSLYDSEILSVDSSLGRLCDALRKRGLYDNTMIVILNDHGEEFNDHGSYYHGHSLYNELTRMVLIVKPPFPTQHHRVASPAQTIDLYPTVAAFLGQSPSVPGNDLGPLLRTGASDNKENVPIYCETDLITSYRSILDGNHKLILRNRRREGRADTFSLFDESRDPLEMNDCASAMPVTAAYLASLIRRHEEQSIKRRHFSQEEIHRTIDEETQRQLEALGYVNAGKE